MSAQRRGLIVTCGIALVSAMLWLTFGTPTVAPRPRLRKIGGVRTKELNRKRIRELNLSLNGVPFGSQRHEVNIGQDVEFVGQLKLHPDQIPTGLISASIMVVHYPVGTEESQWSRRNSRRQWRLPTLRRERLIEQTHQINPKLLPPGDYELRHYLMIRDLEGEDDAFDYLGSAQLQVLPNGFP